MDERIRERRRGISRQRGRHRASLALLGALVVIALACFLWLRSSDVFAVKRVTANPTVHVTVEEIRLVATEAVGENLLCLSTKQLKEQLLAHPYVRSVEVHRCFPDTLYVQIEEYEPVARVQLGNDTWLVASSGRVLEEAPSVPTIDLPLVMTDFPVSVDPGNQLPESVSETLRLAQIAYDTEAGGDLPPIKYVSVSSAGSATLVFGDGSEVRLGEPSNLEQKLRVASQIIKEYLGQGEQLQYVDVSVPDRAAVARVERD